MVGQNPKKIMLRKFHFFISYDVMLGYICAKKNTPHSIKKYKYIHEMIELIFNL